MSSIVIAGDTSGSVTLQAPAVAGTTTLNLPSTTGTIALTSGLPSAATPSALGTVYGVTSSASPNSTFLGYQAGFTNSTGEYNTFLGALAGYTSNGGSSAYNTCVGAASGYSLTTGTNNTFVGSLTPSGSASGASVTTGSKNTILGNFGGNNDSLDIRTGDNYVVISDGSGNRQITMKEGQTLALDSAVPNAGTGITFPATQSASSNANTLDDYEEGSFTFTGTGFTTTPTDTAYYTKIGNQVTVQLPDITGTSNTTLMTITGLPVALRANQAYVSFLLVYNASVSYTGHIYGGHDNTVQVFWDAGESAFTASGVKGITNNVNFTYTLA